MSVAVKVPSRTHQGKNDFISQMWLVSLSKDEKTCTTNLYSYTFSRLSRHSHSVDAVAFSLDSKTVASASDDRTIGL